MDSKKAESGGTDRLCAVDGVAVVNILAYVHLRNIHGSTGAGRVARQLTEHLAVHPRVSVHVLADPADHRRVVPLVGEPWLSMPYHFIQHETSVQQAFWLLTGQSRAESYWPNVDVTFCSAESYVPTKRSALAVLMHDAAIFESDALAWSVARIKQSFKWRLLYRKVARSADIVVTPSAFSADRLAHFLPGLRGRLKVVPNGVPDRFFQPPSPEGEALLSDLGLDSRVFFLVPGGLHYRKNAELILAAWPEVMRHLPDARLVVAGHNTPHYRQRATTLGSSVILTGFVDDEQLCSLYRRACAVWFPTRYEGFGIPAVEAMASGAPLVTSNVASLPDICGSAALLLSPDDPSAHAEALVDFGRNPGRREEFARAGRERASAFTWARSAAILHEVFEGATRR